MTKLTSEEKQLVPSAVKLLLLRQSGGDSFKKAAIDRKLQSMPVNVLTYAESRLSKEIKKQRATSSGVKATLVSAVLMGTETSVGHQMLMTMTVNVPKRARLNEGPEGLPRDLFGVYFEWWEEIVVEYDFVEPPVDETDLEAVKAREERIRDKKESGEGGWHKPWSDIYLSNPVSPTFHFWKQSLEAAAAGSLEGVHETYVNDKPGFNVTENGFRRRILRFRINAADSTGSKLKADALQIMTLEDGTVGRFYQDSTGTTLGTQTGDPVRMAYSSKVDLKVRRNEGSDFVVALESDRTNCEVFENTELDILQKKMSEVGYAPSNLAYAHKDMNKGNQTHILPLVSSGEEFWSRPSTDGGLLVAQLSGGKVKRLWHTDNVARTIDAQINNAPVKYTVRTFEQLPLE